MHYPRDAFPTSHGCPHPPSPCHLAESCYRTPFCPLGRAGSLNYSLKIIPASPGSLPSYSCGMGEAERSQVGGGWRSPGPSAGSGASVRAGEAAPAPRPAPSGRRAPTRPRPRGGARSWAAAQRRGGLGTRSVPPRAGRGLRAELGTRTRGTRRPLRAARSAPNGDWHLLGSPGAAFGAGGIPLPPKRGSCGEGKPSPGSRCVEGGNPFHRGEEGCRGLRWSLPPLPHRSTSTPTRAAPRPRRGVYQLPSLPRPCQRLGLPGGPRSGAAKGPAVPGGRGRRGYRRWRGPPAATALGPR